MQSHGERLPKPDADVLSSVLNACATKARLEASRDAFREAARLNPHYAEAFYGWGTVSLELGDYAQACKQLWRATALDRQFLPAWNNLALAAEAAGQNRLRRRAFRQLTRHSAWGGRTHYMRSLAAYNRGKLHRAISDYRLAFQEAPEHAASFTLLREQLEQQRLELLRLPTFEEWLAEYLDMRLTQTGALLCRMGNAGRVAAPRLLVGASMAAGITLVYYLPPSDRFVEPSSPRLEMPRQARPQVFATNAPSSEAHETATVVTLVPPQSRPATPSVNVYQQEGDVLVATEESSSARAAASLPAGESEATGEPVAQQHVAEPVAKLRVVAAEKRVASPDLHAASASSSSYSMLHGACVMLEEKWLESDAPLTTQEASEADTEAQDKDGGLTMVAPGVMPGMLTPLLLYPQYAYGQGGQNWSSGYNLKVGPMTFNFSAGASLTYNDNVGLSERKAADTIMGVSVSAEGAWPVTDFNTLTLALSLGYKKYLNRSDLDSSSFTIDPGNSSKAEFEILLDEVTIRIYDSPSLTEDPFLEPAISNFTQFRQFQNLFGVEAVWDKEDLVMTGDFNHTYVNMLSTPGYSHLDRHVFNLSGQVNAQYRPWLNIGWTATYTKTHFIQALRSDSHTYGTGPNTEIILSDHLKFTATVLRSWTQFNTASSSDTSLITTSLSLEHDINELMDQQLSYSRTIRPAIDVNANTNISSTYSYLYKWNFADDKNFSTDVTHIRGQEEGAEVFRRTDINLGLTYSFHPQAAATATYGYSWKTTESGQGNYRRNQIVLSTSYQF